MNIQHLFKKEISGWLLLCCFCWLPALAHTGSSFEQRIKNAELTGDRAAVRAICVEWYQSGDCSAGHADWCYNLLMSVESGALLFTQTDSDTYPTWMLQYALNIRPDIEVVPLELLKEPAYRDRLARNIRPFFQESQSLQHLLTYFQQHPESVNLPLYFSILTNKEQLGLFSDKLYLTGLALKYSTQKMDNIPVLKQHIDQDFRMDYLQFSVVSEKNPEALNILNLNYLPALLMLYSSFEKEGNSTQSEAIRTLALKLAGKGGREKEVQLLLTPAHILKQDFITSMSARELDKRVKKVADRFYAGATEVTNAQYEQFLQDLVKNKQFGLLDSCKTAKTDWKSLLPENLRSLDDAVLFKFGHPDNPGFPVQMITHDAAKMYCTWLTRVYNSDNGRKKFKKVLFRLPTEAEWEHLARGGRPDAPYPWGGYFIRNSKGCYLLNLNAEIPCKDCPEENKTGYDGGYFPVGAETYYPNDFGLYNCSGNVAEMIDIPGITKGGSWKDAAYKTQISPQQTYTKPAPDIGFRIVMDVIEE